ncbi:hypothetical protein [Streptomyces sp. NPDC097981]|uniref:hypothetical protein n=1 Tax=Streptomyces sp. NPDC097981 TaxID=3155428 RepID=UPI00332357A9
MESRNALFAAVTITTYMAAAGWPVDPKFADLKELILAADRNDADVFAMADRIRTWIA